MAFQWEDGSRQDLLRLGAELANDPEMALERTKEVLRIRDRLGQHVALDANAAQKEYASRAWGKQRNIVLKARQMGITTWIAGQFFLKTITHPGTVTLQVAHTQEAAEQIFRIVRRFLANMPEVAQRGALKSARVSARGLVIPELDSEYLVETAGDPNAGRGISIANLHCTELARWPGDAAEILYGLLATLSPAGSLAMESTPMGASGCFWKEWQEAEKTNTIRHFLPWWKEGAYRGTAAAEETLTAAERELMAGHQLSLEQIGYRRRIRENFRGLAKQEYAEDADECFFASGSCFFETATLDRRLGEAPEPLEKRGHGHVWIWLPAQPERRYLVAVDPAGGGTAGDFTAMQVIDLESGAQCAELQDHLTPGEAAHAAAELGREYHQALVAVERNSMGLTVLTCLESLERYGNVYQGEDGLDGFLTTSLSRTRMLSHLYSALEDEPRRFRSVRLLRECRSFVRQENGRLEAQAGEHDDLVLAMAIALEAREQQAGRGRVR